MAEYINKEELIKACDYTVCYEDDEETFGISEARIDLMPTIDIVRCGECERKLYCSHIDILDMYNKRSHGEYIDIDSWFCADGERRTE